MPNYEHELDVLRRDAFELPDDVAPVGRKCIKIMIPDDIQWEENFFSCLTLLTKWNSFRKDPDHKATLIASVWRDVIWGSYGACDMFDIRLKPTDFCTIQMSTDGGLTWVDKADLHDCAHAAAVDVVSTAINDGTLSGGGQQPGQGGGVPGQCYSYTITLQGNQRWISPVAVEGGDVITVSDEFGAWFDGNFISGQWNCPDGTPYSLGTCVGSPHTDTGDPLPSVDHMRIIGNLPADATTPYFDMFNTIYDVPGGVSSGDFFLQANDGTLADNQGSITLKVEICKSLWTHVFDFTIDDQGWSVMPGEAGSYSAGLGWDAVFLDAQNYEVGIHITFSSIRLVDCVMTFDRTAHGGANAGYRVQGFGTTTENNIVSGGVDGTDLTLSANFTTNKTQLFCQVNNGTSASPARIKRIVVRGTGVDPF